MHSAIFSMEQFVPFGRIDTVAIRVALGENIVGIELSPSLPGELTGPATGRVMQTSLRLPVLLQGQKNSRRLQPLSVRTCNGAFPDGGRPVGEQFSRPAPYVCLAGDSWFWLFFHR